MGYGHYEFYTEINRKYTKIEKHDKLTNNSEQAKTHCSDLESLLFYFF